MLCIERSVQNNPAPSRREGASTILLWITGVLVNAAMLENEALHVSTVVASVFSLLQLRGYIGHCRRPVAFFDLERCCIHEDMKTPVIHKNRRSTVAPRG